MQEQCGGAATALPGSELLTHAPGGRHQRGVWFAANEFCAFKGDTHLGWGFPFPAPTYYRQGTLHFFAFFAPYFAAGLPAMVGGVLMLLSGPIAAEVHRTPTPNPEHRTPNPETRNPRTGPQSPTPQFPLDCEVLSSASRNWQPNP
jgi:hypothetical protein